jgi:hypothetical protein
VKKFKGSVRLGLVGCVREFEFEVEDDVTDEEIEQIAREVAFEYIDWNYELV